MQVATQRPARRYSGLMLLAAALIFLSVVGVRLAMERLLPSRAAAGPAPAPVEASDESYILRLQERLRRDPDNANSYAELGLALLQRVRETADPQLYLQAETAFAEALKREPEQGDALLGQGLLALSRHDFAGALRWGEQAWALNPYSADALGIIVDAQVELGRYDEAAESLQAMVDLRPGLPSFSRISYLRELHGDMPGAVSAMQQALATGVPGTEAWLWTQVQLGHLYFNQGDLDTAEATYREAQRLRPDYGPAQAAMARVQAARGDHAGAFATLQPLTERLPLAEWVILLGELYEATGQAEAAERQYALVRAIQQLNADAGMNVDLELALFDADHGTDPAVAVERARAAYQARPSLHAADALAWALFRNGTIEEAQQYSGEALRLGTRDGALWYRAGTIALAAGDEAAARRYLQGALDINPHFSVLHAPQARALLDTLPAAP